MAFGTNLRSRSSERAKSRLITMPASPPVYTVFGDRIRTILSDGAAPLPHIAGSGRGGHASRPDVKQVDTTRLMMVLVDNRDAGVGDLHASDLRRLTLGREHRGGWSSPRPVGQFGGDPLGNLFPQAKSGIVTLSPVVNRTEVAERHDSGRSAVVSLLGDRSPAVLNHLEHRWIVPDLLGSLVRLLVPAGNHPHHPVVISGQPSFRECSSTEIFLRTWRSTIRPSRPKRWQSGPRVRRSQLGGGPARSDSAATNSRNQATGRVSPAGGQTGRDALSIIRVSKGRERCLRSPSPRYPHAAPKNRG